MVEKYLKLAQTRGLRRVIAREEKEVYLSLAEEHLGQAEEYLG
jgi:hypothetical protein